MPFGAVPPRGEPRRTRTVRLLADPDLVQQCLRRRELEQGAETLRAHHGLSGAPDVQHRTHRACLACRQAATKVERPTRPVAPLARRGVTDALQLPHRLHLQLLPHQTSRYARVPDRPAEALLDSLVSAVHRQHDAQPVRQDPAEPGLHRLHRQAAVPVDGCALVAVHQSATSRSSSACSRWRRISYVPGAIPTYPCSGCASHAVASSGTVSTPIANRPPVTDEKVTGPSASSRCVLPPASPRTTGTPSAGTGSVAGSSGQATPVGTIATSPWNCSPARTVTSRSRSRWSRTSTPCRSMASPRVIVDMVASL